jgi:hypothetical protein
VQLEIQVQQAPQVVMELVLQQVAMEEKVLLEMQVLRERQVALVV